MGEQRGEWGQEVNGDTGGEWGQGEVNGDMGVNGDKGR